MDSGTIIVHFTESFTKAATRYFSEQDYRELANYLAAHSDAGQSHTEIAALFQLPWTLRSGSNVEVWYLVHEVRLRIDVVAFVGPADIPEQANASDVAQAILRIAFIGRLVYRAYRLYEKAKEALDQLPDG